MTPAQILRAAAEIVERPGGWTQRELARGADGHYVDPLSDAAVCFCMIGAMRRASGAYAGGESAAYTEARTALISQIRRFPGDWNDEPRRIVSDVVDALRRAADTLDPPGAA